MISTAPEQIREFRPGNLLRWRQAQQLLEFECDNQTLLRVTVLSHGLIRLRFSTSGFFPEDFSYAISPDFKADQVIPLVTDLGDCLEIKTAKLKLRLEKSGLRTTFLTLRDEVILEDDKGFHWQEGPDGNDIVMMSKKAWEDEPYFGLGDKTAPLNLRGERTVNWVTDSFGFGAHTQALYRAIPFYMSWRAGKSYGVFFDNPFISYFDFASERNDATSFWAHGGEMDYYFFHETTLPEIVAAYTRLTGVPEMPPIWSLGFHQSKWSYFPEEQVTQLADKFRALGIPCDAIYLDIDYMDGYRCFTWHPERFPNPARLTKALEDKGIKTVVILDPGIKIDPDYAVFQDGLEQGIYCRRLDGPPVKGKVWPGECYFPDFTSPKARAWWAKWCRNLVRVQGVHGVWNDMNEPALFEVPSKTFPPDVMHDMDGHPASHRKAHNLYGMQMSRATYEGLKEHGYPRRPFVITRAAYSGGQRYAATWTGDNIASWEHLRLATIQVQRMNLSGFSFIGSDIGGFAGNPDGELFVRWLQTGIFHPLCRVHSMGYHLAGDEAVDDEAVEENKMTHPDLDQEPWSFGEPFTAAARKAIRLRYEILPVLYTAFYQHRAAAMPIIRSVALMHPEDPMAREREEEFYLGDHLLVCPVSVPGAKGRYVYLPEGNWRNYFTGKRFPGGQEVWCDAALDEIPVFVREGAVIPVHPVRASTAFPFEEPATLRVFLGKTENPLMSQWYEDAGDGYGHEQGDFLLRAFRFTGDAKRATLTQATEGRFKSPFPVLRIEAVGVAGKVPVLRVDGKTIPYQRTETGGYWVVPADFRAVEWSF
jgi:alpha-glucosidase